MKKNKLTLSRICVFIVGLTLMNGIYSDVIEINPRQQSLNLLKLNLIQEIQMNSKPPRSLNFSKRVK
jgi:hypothetical protein